MSVHSIFQELEEAARKGRQAKYSNSDLKYDLPDFEFIGIVSRYFSGDQCVPMGISIGMDLVRSGEWERGPRGFDLKNLKGI